MSSIPSFSISTLQSFRNAKDNAVRGRFIMKVDGKIAAAADTAELLDIACNEYSLAAMRYNTLGVIELFNPEGRCYAD